ncbi:MAG TPA: hypothetical protein VFW25_11060 [Silvibacterium sp.]|nr:hypothetical protein [Silvibacterium sp.]
MKKTILSVAVVLLCQFAHPQQAAPAVNLNSLGFLLGKWVGEGKDAGMPGSGYCSFEAALQAKVIVRQNHAEYPATANHPAVVHDDLMIIYPDSADHQVRAFYTDSEGHVIRYTVAAASDGGSAVFLGDAEAGAPRYRLTYTVTQTEYISLTFEIAPPGHPDQFHKYIEAKLRKSGKSG